MCRFRLVLLCVLLAAAGCAVPQAQNTPVWQKHEMDPTTGMGYWIYVSSRYNPNTPAPLIISCHGTPPFDVAEHHIREWKMLAEKNGCIVVCPELLATDGLLGNGPVIGMLADEKYILSLISMLGYRYNIDRANVMITGFSGGGFPTYWIGLRHPEVFSVIAARNCNFSRGNVDGWYPPEARNTKVLVYYGQNDPPTIAFQSRAAISYLKGKGFNVKKDVLKGYGHQRRPDVAMKFFRQHWRAPKPSM